MFSFISSLIFIILIMIGLYILAKIGAKVIEIVIGFIAIVLVITFIVMVIL